MRQENRPQKIKVHKKLCTYPGCTAVVVSPAIRCDRHPHKPIERKHYEHHYLPSGSLIYDSIEWKRIRKARLLLNPLCQHCELVGVIKKAVDVDHIVEIEDGGEPFDLDNTQSLCRSCHNRKTAMSKRNRNKPKQMRLSDFKRS